MNYNHYSGGGAARESSTAATGGAASNPSSSSFIQQLKMHITPEYFTLTPTFSEDTALQFSNPHDATVIYKIKATSPERFIVRPRQGIVRPRSTETVSITLQKGVNQPSEDQFQVEYRLLQLGEAVPEAERIAEVLKLAISTSSSQGGSNNTMKVSSQRKIIQCRVLTITGQNSEQFSASPSNQRGSNIRETSVIRQQSQEHGTTPSSSSTGIMFNTTSTSAVKERETPGEKVSRLTLEMEKLDANCSNFKNQITQQRSSFADAEMRKQKMKENVRKEELKIEQLEGHQRMAKQLYGQRPFRVNIWVACVIMIGVALLGRYW